MDKDRVILYVPVFWGLLVLTAMVYILVVVVFGVMGG